MMKMKLLTCVLVVTSVGAFAPAPSRQSTMVELNMGLFDNMFKPIHGHGSGEKQLEEAFREEQNVLKDRKAHYQKKQLKKKYKKSDNWLMNMFAEPLHGHGSGEDDLEEIFKAQQQVLYERREYFGNKDALKKKYKNFNQSHLGEIKVHEVDPAEQNKKEDKAMYIDEGYNFKFPWENKKLKP